MDKLVLEELGILLTPLVDIEKHLDRIATTLESIYAVQPTRRDLAAMLMMNAAESNIETFGGDKAQAAEVHVGRSDTLLAVLDWDKTAQESE